MNIRTDKVALMGMTLAELESVAKGLGMPKFAAKQMAQWLYGKRVTDVDAMSNLSLKARHMLNEAFVVGRSAPVEARTSADGTKKYLFRTHGGHFIESVYIPDNDRATLCVSSQVGCKMGCRFCMTGRQGFKANLTANEILNQVFSIPESATLTNIVLMGMGEPMDNIDEVMKALDILTSAYGCQWSPRRITVSTVGLRKGLARFLKESECHLAVSMHTPMALQRANMIPAEKAFPIKDIVELLKQYDWSKQRRLSFEYTMFHGQNDSLVYAKEVARLLRGLECRVNLIRFHAIPGSTFQTADPDQMTAFRDYLTKHGVFATIRASRGEDIEAACGMLAGKASSAQSPNEPKDINPTPLIQP